MDRYEIVYWLVVQVPKIPLSSSQSNRLWNLSCTSQPLASACGYLSELLRVHLETGPSLCPDNTGTWDLGTASSSSHAGHFYWACVPAASRRGT